MRPADAHLTPQEFELLLFAAGDSKTDAGGASAPEAQQHLNGCVACQSVAEKYRNGEEKLKSLELWSQASRERIASSNAGNSAPIRRPDCPAEQIWFLLAAGLLPDTESALYVTHVARCDWCGPLLKEAMQDLAQDATLEEQEALAKLPTASVEWQHEMAKEMAEAVAAQRLAANPADTATATGTARVSDTAEDNDPLPTARKQSAAKQKKAGFTWWPKLAWAGAAAAVIVAAGWFIWLKTREPDVNQLLAQAYTEQRTIELRISGAQYARIREHRGGSGSNINRSAALYKALSLLAESPQQRDAAWLGTEGKAELLQGDYVASVAALEQANLLSPQADDIEIDLASALVQRSSQPGFEEDLPRSVNLLHDVISRNPQNTIALFNLAIASERMHLFAEAKRAWDEYLKIDPNSAWSQEARARKEKLEKEIEDYKKRSGQPLEGPDALANLTKASPDQLKMVDQRIESYLATALADWLPEIVAAQRSSRENTNTEAAATEIAQLAFQSHEDLWLRDLLAEVGASHEGSSGIVFLSKSQKSNEQGHFQEANAYAKNAEQLFTSKGEVVGRLSAKVQEVYSLHQLQQGEICYREASNLLSGLHGKAYVWLETQTLLEASICANMTGRLREAKLGADRAAALAEAHHYGNLYLRAVALLASLEWTSGNFSKAIRFVSDGLDIFWKGSYQPIRGYSLYSVLDSIAEDSQEWFVQLSVGSEAVGLVMDSPYHAMLGVECERIGNAALHTFQIAVAERFFQDSLNHFALAPKDTNSGILSATADIGMARVDLQRGRVATAHQWLQRAEQWAGKTDNRFVQVEFYETKAEVLQATGLTDAAKESSLQAVAVAEKSLRTINGERARLIWMREYDRVYRVLIDLELAEDPNSAYFWWEWYRATPIRASQKIAVLSDSLQTLRTASQQMVTVADRLVPDDAAIVSYILLGHEAGAWFRHGAVTRYYKLPASTVEIESLAHALARDCANENSNPGGILVQERKLYNILVRPFAAEIANHEKLLIEPDGDLDALPFEILADENGMLVGQKHEITLSPGIAYLAGARPSLKPDSATTALIITNSSSHASGINELASFESAVDEARNIQRLIPNSQVLRGQETSLAAIMQMAHNADIFYFVGHALPEKDGSGLLFGSADAVGQPEVINAAVLEKFRVEKIKLVVLSACETAGDSSHTLSASGSLARVFLVAGVPQVVASRWPVDSHATTILMESFYRHLFSGSRVGEALGQAQQELRTQAGYSHPYYWAAFSVFGAP